jgi:hypothetical protein
MPLTKEFRETILEDLADPEFRSAYLTDAISAIREGEISVAARMLDNYLEASRRGVYRAETSSLRDR